MSAHFDAAIALSLLAGACLPYATGTRARILGACAIVPVLVAWPFAVQHSLAELSDAPRAARASRQAVAAIAALPGDVACQSVALCFWAGKPFVLDWFLTNQHIALTGDRSALTNALAARRFAAVQLDPATPRDGDDAIRAAVTAAYERRIAFPVGMLLQSR